MAHVIRSRTGSWELRESAMTPAGPRSRTLATFKALTPAILEHARDRSARPLDDAEIREAARRAGAPVAQTPANAAAGTLLAELAGGRRPRRALRRLLIEALGEATSAQTDAARAAGAWVAASLEERGEALRDLLLLTDRLPPPRTTARARFARIDSGAT